MKNLAEYLIDLDKLNEDIDKLNDELVLKYNNRKNLEKIIINKCNHHEDFQIDMSYCETDDYGKYIGVNHIITCSICKKQLEHYTIDNYGRKRYII